MKNSAQTLLTSATIDNEQEISESGLTVKEFFKNEFEICPENFFCWMTEDEIERWESGDREDIISSFNDLF